MRQQPFASPEEALQHYGVKGMRWGYRKKEETTERSSTEMLVPKTSTTSTTAAVVKSASGAAQPVLSPRTQARVDKFMQRSDVINTQIADLRRSNEELLRTGNPYNTYTRSINNQTITQLQVKQKQALKDAEAAKKGRLTSTQKKMIVGGVVVGATLAYMAYAQGKQSGALNSYQMLAKARFRGQKVPFNVDKSLSGKMSAADILKKVAAPVNPNYRLPGGQMNCRRCTYAYELRRRGFDVHATTSSLGWGQSESGVINAMTPGSRNFYNQLSVSTAVREFGETRKASGDSRVRPLSAAKTVIKGLDKGRQISTLSNSTKVLEELAKQPEGARGEVLFRFPGFGHSMAYEIINGKPHIFDSQKGTLYNATSKMVESKWDGFHSAEITRLDDVKLDYKFLSRWAANQ